MTFDWPIAGSVCDFIIGMIVPSFNITFCSRYPHFHAFFKLKECFIIGKFFKENWNIKSIHALDNSQYIMIIFSSQLHIFFITYQGLLVLLICTRSRWHPVENWQSCSCLSSVISDFHSPGNSLLNKGWGLERLLYWQAWC